MTLAFWISLALLCYVYDAYLRLLRLLAAFSGGEAVAPAPAVPTLGVLITVRDEAHQIVERVRNVLDCDYPADALQVVVASDGSTDGTDEAVIAIADPRVRLFRPEQRRGKSETQNAAIEALQCEVVVFTDADTRFSREFLREIAAPFADPAVGCVDGHLVFVNDGESGVARSQGYYWSFELRLRQAESGLGILAVASGACLAVRRALLRPLPATVGEDCIVPLDVVAQGSRVVHAARALAYDRTPDDPRSEFRSRVRMTLRNWQGTWSRPQLLNPFAHPGYAFALWSHKLLRWLSPLYLVILTASAIALAPGSTPYGIACAGLAAFYALGAAGWLAQRVGRRLPVASTVFSFLLANLGFAAGLFQALLGSRIARYK